MYTTSTSDQWFLQAGRYTTKGEKPMQAADYSLIEPPSSTIDEKINLKQVEPV